MKNITASCLVLVLCVTCSFSGEPRDIDLNDQRMKSFVYDIGTCEFAKKAQGDCAGELKSKCSKSQFYVQVTKEQFLAGPDSVPQSQVQAARDKAAETLADLSSHDDPAVVALYELVKQNLSMTDDEAKSVLKEKIKAKKK